MPFTLRFQARQHLALEGPRLKVEMNVVEKPVNRSNSHAFGCSLVVRMSYDTFTSAPIEVSQSSARRSVDPGID
jgi:hypothetical protein